MRLNYLFLAGFILFGAAQTQAALKDQPVKYQQAIVQDDQLIHQTKHQPFYFRVEIVADDEGVKPETNKNGAPFVTAAPGERYSVRLYNPLPVRVAVNLTVDGLNAISGQPSGIADGDKWMIEPNSFITIPGWQVSGGEARRFFFTDKPKSYAKWRGDVTGKDLSANCGVIGAAYFWSQKELDEYYENHPIYRYTRRICPSPLSRACDGASNSPACAQAEGASAENLSEKVKKSEDHEQAGTGMGERESHPSIQVAFNYDTGMYSLSQALVIYYDFAKTPSPNPFPAMSYAPQMP